MDFQKGFSLLKKKLSLLCSESADRRIDIVAFVKKGDRLDPLLLVECKAEALEEEVVFRQAIGYNASFAAPFWCLAHRSGVRTFWKEESGIQSVPFLPSYAQLVEKLR